MPDMTTNQRTGCMSAIFAAWMLFFGVGLIVTALFNHGVVGWSPLYNGINSVGISFLLFCFYKFHYPRLVKRDTSDFKIVADFETPGRADIAAMYLRSHDIFAVVTNTGDAA